MLKVLLILCCLTISLNCWEFKPKMEYEIPYEGFVVDYDSTSRIPSVVYYEIEYDKLGQFGRSTFGPDKSVKNPSYEWEYTNTGYDRGHLMPSASSQSTLMMEDCFYMTNIAPQEPRFNRVLWKSIEVFERNNSSPKLYVITGTHLGDWKYLGQTKVRVPEYFYKILYNKECNSMIAFLCSQSDGNKRKEDCIVTVDSLEILTKRDFYYQLEDSLEEVLERTVDVERWEW